MTNEELYDMIKKEVADRIAADAQLQNQLNNEASARTSTDSQLQANIEAEANTRMYDDNKMMGLIDLSVPVGTVLWFAASTAPTGFLECDGRVLSSENYPELVSVIGTTYGANGELPDLRGEFVRGWDHGKGVDNGRIFGSWQEDLLKTHSHLVPYQTTGFQFNTNSYGNFVNRQYPGVTGNAPTSCTGGNETRGRNIALLPCIKF